MSEKECLCERQRVREGGKEILTKLKQKTTRTTITKHKIILTKPD